LTVVAVMKKPNDHAEPTKIERYFFLSSLGFKLQEKVL